MRRAGALVILVALAAAAVTLAFAVEAVTLAFAVEPPPSAGHAALPAPDPSVPPGADPAAVAPSASSAPPETADAMSAQAGRAAAAPVQESGGEIRVAALVNGALAGAAIAALALSQMNRREPLS